MNDSRFTRCPVYIYIKYYVLIKRLIEFCDGFWDLELLKEKMQISPVLISTDFKKPNIFQTDASRGLGYLISQEVDNELRPIKFGGRLLNKSELNYDNNQGITCY